MKRRKSREWKQRDQGRLDRDAANECYRGERESKKGGS